MSELKNLKISAETHDALRKRAERLGMKINRLADALLHMALSQNDNIIHAAILQLSQENDGASAPPREILKLPVVDTTPGPPKRTRKPPSA